MASRSFSSCFNREEERAFSLQCYFKGPVTLRNIVAGFYVNITLLAKKPCKIELFYNVRGTTRERIHFKITIKTMCIPLTENHLINGEEYVRVKAFIDL